MKTSTQVVDQHETHLRHAIYRLRYDVLVNEQKKYPEYADHLLKILKEPLDDKGLVFAHVDSDIVIGTCRVNGLMELDMANYSYHCLDYFKQHGLSNQVGVASRLILHPSYRGTHTFKALTKNVVKTAFNNGISVLIIDGVVSLLNLYHKLGFLPYGTSFTHKDGMEVIPMILDANNQTHLKEINSTLLSCYPDNFCEDETIKNKVSELIRLGIKEQTYSENYMKTQYLNSIELDL